MQLILAVIIIVLLTPVLLTSVAIALWRNQNKRLLKQDPNYSLIELNVNDYAPESQEWYQQMSHLGEQFSSYGITQTHFIHGTFAGHDPLDLAHHIEKAFPVRGPIIAEFLRFHTQHFKNAALNDLGNFSEQYRMTYQKALGNGMNAYTFTWSSGNHHLARVQGAIALLEYLSTFLEWHAKEQRLMLIGHSHAGQLFSLITHWVDSPQLMTDIVSSLSQHQETSIQYDRIKMALNRLINKKIIFVTLGTPARYQWKTNPNWQIVHLINHRGNSCMAPSLWGIPWTLGGDYVQQLGIAGSDSFTPSSTVTEINKSLAQWLGPGRDWKHWHQQLKLKNRLHNEGHHLLIDYHDDSLLPNFFKTILGHGHYTKLCYMFPNLKILLEHLRD